jgi:sarcosine oxidase, subunit alpha
MSAFRSTSGGLIERSRRLTFDFDGRTFEGCGGDTLASALLANGVHLIGRSFKYHRPRGILTAGSSEPNALVGVWRDAARYTPNLRATQVELYDGLQAESQNRSPSLAFDLGAINGLMSPFIPAGFYYKTFMWPRRFWKSVYEPMIRARAGLGRAPQAADPDRYASRFAHCDVLVIGAGPAGLAAARAAAEDGARVLLCDEQPQFGGSLLEDPTAIIEGRPAADWLRDTLVLLGQNPRVTLLTRSTAFGYFPHNLIGINERLTDHLAAAPARLPRERLWQVRAHEVVLAAGTLERPLVFPGNDRPGIMLAGAARSYLHRYGVRCGSRAVVVAGCDEAYRAALDLQTAGVTIAAVVDPRERCDGPLRDAARGAGLPIREQRTTVLGTRGRLRVSAVHVGRVGVGGDAIPAETIQCDLVLMSGGHTPCVHLYSQSRGKLAWNAQLQSFLPDEPAERVRCAGACRGIYGLEAVIADGATAGHGAARHERPVAPVYGRARANGTLGALPAQNPPRGKAFVDWQNDVTAADLLLATREGFRSIEHVKRYTTTGMATDQGKSSNLNALAIVASHLGKALPEVGLTTFRMPYTPVSFGSMASRTRGDLFDPVRATPMHGWAEEHGAEFENVALWKRARYFPRAGENMHRAVARECLAVRNQCGIFDASTLGKIEVVGRDAATFMNRMYVNSWTKLAVGRTRYGILLREDGFILDDGVVARTAEDRFHVTTTTGGAAGVLARMEDYLQTEWSDLLVWLTSTTEQWAVIAVQGPAARQVLLPLIEGIDIGPGAFPHMSVAKGHICGAPLLLFRVSFSGELGFEVNVPADYGRSVWEAIYSAGQSFGMTPYGTETMHVLRAEKGYIIVGQDTDGTVTADDVGLGWAIAHAKPDFVGKRSLERPALRSPERKQLVGLLTSDPQVVLEEGAQITETPGQPLPMRLIGHVSSSYYSAALGRSIALALVAGGRARMGQTLYVPMPGEDVPVQVASPLFYDPKGERLNG